MARQGVHEGGVEDRAPDQQHPWGPVRKALPQAYRIRRPFSQDLGAICVCVRPEEADLGNPEREMASHRPKSTSLSPERSQQAELLAPATHRQSLVFSLRGRDLYISRECMQSINKLLTQRCPPSRDALLCVFGALGSGYRFALEAFLLTHAEFSSPMTTLMPSRQSKLETPSEQEAKETRRSSRNT